jgi:hypothetical protein
LALKYLKGHVYYYKTVREGSRIRRIYVTRGPFALALAEDDRERQREREIERIARQESALVERMAYHAEKGRGETIKALVAVGLEAWGFVRYRRGLWSRRAMKAIVQNGSESSEQARSTIRRLIGAFCNGDRTGISQLQELARTYPQIFIKEAVADPMRLAVESLAASETRGNAKLCDGLIAQVGLVAAELAGPGPTAARRLAAEAAAFHWLESWLLNAKAAHAGMNGQSIEFSQRRTAAARRFASALRTFHRISVEEVKPTRAKCRIA